MRGVIDYRRCIRDRFATIKNKLQAVKRSPAITPACIDLEQIDI